MNMPLELCEARDPKGLYKLAREGKIRGKLPIAITSLMNMSLLWILENLSLLIWNEKTNRVCSCICLVL